MKMVNIMINIITIITNNNKTTMTNNMLTINIIIMVNMTNNTMNIINDKMIININMENMVKNTIIMIGTNKLKVNNTIKENRPLDTVKHKLKWMIVSLRLH